MELDQLRDFIDSAPSSAEPDLDTRARAWLASLEVEFRFGEGDPVVLVAVAVDEDADVRLYALPAEQVDAKAHHDLAAVHQSGFEFFFASDLEPQQFAGALRICGGMCEEPDVFEEQVEEVAQQVEDAGTDLGAIRASVGTWLACELAAGQEVRGPIHHVYAVTVSM